MQFLLQLPPPVSFFIVSAVTTFFGLTGVYLVRKKYSVQQGVRDYLAGVYNDELSKLAEGDLDLYSGGAHNSMKMLFAQVDANSIPNRELYGEALKCLNNLAQYRRMRIFAGNDTVPPVIWLVLLVGCLFAVSYTFFFGMKNIRAQYLITTTLTVTVTSILFLIYVLDHPFTGASRVSFAPLREAMATIKVDDAGD